MRSIMTLSLLAFVLLVATAGWPVTGTAAAQQTDHSSHAQPPPAPQQPSAAPEMKQRHEQMMARMKTNSAKLSALVQEMNTATGEAKITAMAAVINELVQQQHAMHAMMGEMHQHMMGGRGARP